MQSRFLLGRRPRGHPPAGSQGLTTSGLEHRPRLHRGTSCLVPQFHFRMDHKATRALTPHSACPSLTNRPGYQKQVDRYVQDKSPCRHHIHKLYPQNRSHSRELVGSRPDQRYVSRPPGPSLRDQRDKLARVTAEKKTKGGKVVRKVQAKIEAKARGKRKEAKTLKHHQLFPLETTSPSTGKM